MLCYSYEHRAATNLYKNVGRKLWGCAAHSHGTQDCRDEWQRGCRPRHMLPINMKRTMDYSSCLFLYGSSCQLVHVTAVVRRAVITRLPDHSISQSVFSIRSVITDQLSSVFQVQSVSASPSVDNNVDTRLSKCQCLIWLLSLLCGLLTKNIVIVKGNIILSK